MTIFESFLMGATFFEAAGAVAKTSSSHINLTKFNQVKLVQIPDTIIVN